MKVLNNRHYCHRKNNLQTIALVNLYCIVAPLLEKDFCSCSDFSLKLLGSSVAELFAIIIHLTYLILPRKRERKRERERWRERERKIKTND